MALANDNYDFSQIDDFGEITNKSLHDWWHSKDPMVELLPMEVNFIVDDGAISSASLDGKSFVLLATLFIMPIEIRLLKLLKIMAASMFLA